MSRLIGIILMALFLQPMAQMTWGQETGGGSQCGI